MKERCCQKGITDVINTPKITKDKIQRKEKRSICEILVKIGASSSRLDQNCLFSSGLQQLTIFYALSLTAQTILMLVCSPRWRSQSHFTLLFRGLTFPCRRSRVYKSRSALCRHAWCSFLCLERLLYSTAPKILTVLMAVPVLPLLCCLAKRSSERASELLSCPYAGPQHLSVCTCLSLSGSGCVKAKGL